MPWNVRSARKPPLSLWNQCWETERVRHWGKLLPFLWITVGKHEEYCGDLDSFYGIDVMKKTKNYGDGAPSRLAGLKLCNVGYRREGVPLSLWGWMSWISLWALVRGILIFIELIWWNADGTMARGLIVFFGIKVAKPKKIQNEGSKWFYSWHMNRKDNDGNIACAMLSVNLGLHLVQLISPVWFLYNMFPFQVNILMQDSFSSLGN